MARMIITRLPSNQDLEEHELEAESFLEAFNKQAISPFTAEVEITDDGRIELDGWSLIPEDADWFKVEK